MWQVIYPHLSFDLAENKLRNDLIRVIDHLMDSKAFRIANRLSILCVLLGGISLTVGGQLPEMALLVGHRLCQWASYLFLA